jgi:hypothetical protein
MHKHVYWYHNVCKMNEAERMAASGPTLPAYAVPVINRLHKLQGRYPQFNALCPAHEDHNPSLSVRVSEEKIVLYCHRACTPEAIVQAVGLDMTALFADSAPAPMPLPFTRKPRSDETLVEVYKYTDHAGNVIAEKGRFESAEVTPDGKPRKTFRWRLAGQQGWPGLGGVEMASLALWGAETVQTAPADTMVYYVEGERAAVACRAAGLVAVTHAGGSGTNDFGASLEVLRGRKVALWPDNDATGRDYMAKVEARLRGVARVVTVVNVTVPPKGDAVEYFAQGGTVAALEAGARRIDGPTVDYLGEDTIRVIIPTADGTITFTFASLERTGARSLDCELTVELAIPGKSSDPYEENVNLLSRTAKTELRRELEAVFEDKKFSWAVHINKAFSMARKEYSMQDRSTDVADIPDAENGLFFHDPILPDRAPTIFFGDGSSLKSFLSFELAYCIAHGLPFMGYRAHQVPVLVVDYEDEEQNFRRRMKRIALGHGRDDFEPRMIRYLPAHGMPLADLTDSIKQIIREWGIGFMIVDSVGPACGGKPEDAIVGLAYARTVKKIGVTSLHIAHISKEDVKRGNTTHPFGSIFWHNEARRTWFIAREQEEESDELDIGMFCRKVNDGPKPKPLAAHVRFEGLYGAVQITRQDISSIPEMQAKRSHKAQVMDSLAQQAGQTIKEIAADTGLTENAIEGVVRDKRSFSISGVRPSASRGRGSNEYSLLFSREAPTG